MSDTTNTTKHTPGPWQFNPGKPGILAYQPRPDGSEGYWREIARLEPIKAAAHHGGCDPESQANGQLIAAAPKLLDAAQHALEGIEGFGNLELKQIASKLRSVIEQAGGR